MLHLTSFDNYLAFDEEECRAGVNAALSLCGKAGADRQGCAGRVG